MGKAWKRWLTLFILCLGGGVIYQLPYLRYAYYVPLKDALHLSNYQLGVLMSTYGIVAMICYFPGGWLADRLSVRKMLTFSFVATGLGGLYFATFPSYVGAIGLHIYWGITTTLTYWAALIKVTRDLGNSSEQGRMYGLLEGGRGLISTLAGMIILALFTRLGANAFGLKWAITSYAVLSIIVGIITWFVFDETKSTEKTAPVLDDIKKVIKMPEMWLIALIIFSTYTMYAGQSYLTPYVTEIFGASVSLGALLGLVRTYGLQMLGGPTGGFIADKVGSASQIIKYGYVIIAICLALFMVIPGNPAFLGVVVVNMVVMGLAVYAMRGIYFATIDEGKISPALTGAAAGLASMIGFTPDVFLYPLIGSWLDKHPGALGYQYMFRFMFVIAIVGLVIVSIFIKIIKKKKTSKSTSLKVA